MCWTASREIFWNSAATGRNNAKLLFNALAKPSPLGKVACRRHDGRGVQAVRFRRNTPNICTLYRTSPAPFGGTLPKGEGLYQNDKLKFEKPGGRLATRFPS